MKSPEKVLRFLEELESFNDEEIGDAVPLGIPAPMLRMALAGVAGSVSDDAAELDEFLTKLGDWCLGLRSDREEVSADEAIEAV